MDHLDDYVASSSQDGVFQPGLKGIRLNNHFTWLFTRIQDWQVMNQSLSAGVADGLAVEGVPVAVPHHESLQRVVVVGQPLSELGNNCRSVVIGRASSRGGSQHSYQQFITRHTAEVRDGLFPTQNSREVPPVEVDVLEVVERAPGDIVPIVIRLGLVVVDARVCQLDDVNEIVVGLASCVCRVIGNSLVDCHTLGRHDQQFGCADGSTELVDHVGYSSGGDHVGLDVDVDTVQAVGADNRLHRTDEIVRAVLGGKDVGPVSVLPPDRDQYFLAGCLPFGLEVGGVVVGIDEYRAIGTGVDKGEDDVGRGGVDVVVSGLSAEISSEATVEHGQGGFDGVFLVFPGYLEGK